MMMMMLSSLHTLVHVPIGVTHRYLTLPLEALPRIANNPYSAFPFDYARVQTIQMFVCLIDKFYSYIIAVEAAKVTARQ